MRDQLPPFRLFPHHPSIPRVPPSSLRRSPPPVMSSPSRLLERSVSSTSNASDSTDDWDRSLTLPSTSFIPEDDENTTVRTPRNSVLFPAEETTPGRSTMAPYRGAEGKRTLSDLLKLHAEKGTACAFTQEEATRVGDVLGQWVGGVCYYYGFCLTCCRSTHR